MELKIVKIVDCFLIFLLCFVTHFVFDWFPNTLFSIFFPVNESIWEHMKMLFSAIIIYGIIDFTFLRSLKIYFNNFLTSLFLSGIFGVMSFLIIYMPLFYIFGNNMIMNFVVLFISH